MGSRQWNDLGRDREHEIFPPVLGEHITAISCLHLGIHVSRIDSKLFQDLSTALLASFSSQRCRSLLSHV